MRAAEGTDAPGVVVSAGGGAAGAGFGGSLGPAAAAGAAGGVAAGGGAAAGGFTPAWGAAGAAGGGAGVPAAGAGIPGLAGAAGAAGCAGACPVLPGGGALGLGGGVTGGFCSSPVNRLMATSVCLVVGSASACPTPNSKTAVKPTTYRAIVLMVSSRCLTSLPVWPLRVRALWTLMRTRRPLFGTMSGRTHGPALPSRLPF